MDPFVSCSLSTKYIYAMAYNSFPGFGYIILYVYLSNIVGGLTEGFVYSIILKRIST